MKFYNFIVVDEHPNVNNVSDVILFPSTCFIYNFTSCWRKSLSMMPDMDEPTATNFLSL